MTFLIYKKLLFFQFYPTDLVNTKTTDPSGSVNSARYVPRRFASYYTSPLFTSPAGNSCILFWHAHLPYEEIPHFPVHVRIVTGRQLIENCKAPWYKTVSFDVETKIIPRTTYWEPWSCSPNCVKEKEKYVDVHTFDTGYMLMSIPLTQARFVSSPSKLFFSTL